MFSGDMMFDAARLLVIRAPDVAPSVGSNGYLTTGESNSR